MSGALSLRGLTKRFGDDVAVDGIDLDIGEGEFFSLLGASGCGKTTTLRMIAGFERPDGGSIHLDGRDLSQVPPHRRPVNTVFQSYGLFPFLDVNDNVAFGLRYTDATPADVRRRVGAALELVQLASLAKRKPHQLSGGQRQRVALARALVLEPTVLLLDEPMGALDAKLRRQLQVELRSLQRLVGTTFVYVTHDQEEALTMSDRLAVMVDGHVEQIGTPSEMYAAPATAYVAGFLGSANLLEGTVVDTGPGLIGCEVGGLRLVAESSRRATVGDTVTLLLRPERIEVGPAAEPTSTAGTNVFGARIERVVFRGGHTHLAVRAAACTLTAEVANVHGELPDWVGEGRDACVRVSHRSVQLLPTGERGPAGSSTAEAETDADAEAARHT